MLTVTMLFIAAAFISTLIAAYGKTPLWVPVLFICIVLLLQVLPK